MKLTFPHFDHTEVEQVRACLESGWVTQGPRVAQFEAEIAKRHQVRHALATTSCTAALHLAMLALRLQPRDEVIVPAFTWVTSAHCAEYVGARAVFVDVDPGTYNLDPRAFEAAITPQTRAVVAVHLFGLAVEMEEILAIARPRNIFVVEDAACAIGTTYKGRPVGGIGDIGCFSFHPRKIVTTGEGGIVATNNDATAELVCSFRNHGSTGASMEERANPRPWSLDTFNNLGFNLRLSDIQAAVGLAQMAKLDRLLAERRAAAARYTELLRGVNDLALPLAGDASGHTFQSYVIRLQEGGRARRNTVMEALDQAGIQTRPGTHAVHRLGYYADKYDLRAEHFPNAAMCEDTTITLPIFPGITEADQQRVAMAIKAAL